MMTSTLANITDEYLIWKASAEILVAIMKLGRVFKNAFGVWPRTATLRIAKTRPGKKIMENYADGKPSGRACHSVRAAG
jgi:hypothetical protein